MNYDLTKSVLAWALLLGSVIALRLCFKWWGRWKARGQKELDAEAQFRTWHKDQKGMSVEEWHR